MDKPLPAFGAGHDDSTLWGIAAFVERLPALSPERYRTLGGSAQHAAQGEAAEHGGPAASAAQHGGTTR